MELPFPPIRDKSVLVVVVVVVRRDTLDCSSKHLNSQHILGTFSHRVAS